jgi:hypothetical protein
MMFFMLFSTSELKVAQQASLNQGHSCNAVRLNVREYG